MHYQNATPRKIRGSLPMIVSCGVCKFPLVRYQKVGKGALRRLHVSRALESEIRLGYEQNLTCPQCGTVLGHLIELDGQPVYRMLRGKYNMTEE